jgi:lycopene beta-cyclase
MQVHQADIIIAGGGLAGLTLALECTRDPFFASMRVVILERDDKQKNDRTWCFWADKNEPLPPVVYKSWSNCRFYNYGFEKQLAITPYQYHMIRGIDFYRWAKQTLAEKKQVTWVKTDIQSIDTEAGVVQTDMGAFHGTWVFNSALRLTIEQPTTDTRYTHLLQHFKGWVLRTKAPVFDPATVTLMDYRVPQLGDTRFVYVLPFSPTEALVEYTVFSPELDEPALYDRALTAYLQDNLGITEFDIQETEFGVIPMANTPFPTQEGKVWHIGTAGGFVKGSSGYAFLRTQRKIRAFVEEWARLGAPSAHPLKSTWRFRFYDSVMLRVLEQGAVPGHKFFTSLFQKLPADLVWRFLDEDSTFAEELRMMSAPPTWPFLQTAIRQIPIFPAI